MFCAGTLRRAARGLDAPRIRVRWWVSRRWFDLSARAAAVRQSVRRSDNTASLRVRCCRIDVYQDASPLLAH